MSLPPLRGDYLPLPDKNLGRRPEITETTQRLPPPPLLTSLPLLLCSAAILHWILLYLHKKKTFHLLSIYTRQFKFVFPHIPLSFTYIQSPTHMHFIREVKRRCTHLMSFSIAHVHPCVIHTACMMCVTSTALYLHSLLHGYIAPGPSQLAYRTLCHG